jgi:hypothetical protein
MALKGEQFNNTYMPGRPDWLSPEHHTNQGPDHLTKLHRSTTHFRTDPVTDEEITTFDVNTSTGKHTKVSDDGQTMMVRDSMPVGELDVISDSAPAPPEELLPGTNRQGMLFDPYTGTGLPRDPTVSKEQRLAAVEHQLNLRGQGAPQLAETYAMGDEPVSEFYRPRTRSPHGRTVPNPDEKAGRPKIMQGRGKRGGGHYQPLNNTATVQKLRGQSTTEYQTRSMNRPTKDATSTGTEWNPDWYTGGSSGKGKGIMPKGSKVEDDANEPYITANILKHSFHNPETGETLNPHTGPNEPVFMEWDEETPEEIASNRRYGNQIHVPGRFDHRPDFIGNRREVTGTRGKADEFKHLGSRFNPSLDTTYVQSWDTAQSLKDLHEAGFQSELHRGSGHTGDISHLPPGVESEAQKANPDRPENYTPPDGPPEKEYHPWEEPWDGRGLRGNKPVMLPTKEAEGFLTKVVEGGERVPEGEYRSGVDYSTFFHKRRIPSETETVERQSKQVTEWPDASTAFHERAHAIDPNIGLRTVNRGDTRDAHRDPVHEGIADAATDRTIEYANVHEDALNPSLNPNRFLEVEDRKQVRGYGTKNTAWKTDQDRAVYAATRIHSAMADEHNIPDRVDLVKEQFGLRGFNARDDELPVRVTHQRTASGRTIPVTEKSSNTSGDLNIHSERNTDRANNTLLGKLYHENEHVRDGLDQLGFSRIGLQAAEMHVQRMDEAASVAEDAAPNEWQLSFWPREGVLE